MVTTSSVQSMIENPKTDPSDNTEKNPDDWVSGDEPMTGAEASYRKTLSEQLHLPDAYAEDLTKAEASKRIDALKARRRDSSSVLSRLRNIDGSILTRRSLPSIWPRMKLCVLTNSVTRRRRTGAARARVRA